MRTKHSIHGVGWLRSISFYLVTSKNIHKVNGFRTYSIRKEGLMSVGFGNFFASNLDRLDPKKIESVPKNVMPIHAVARLALSFSNLLRSAFRCMSSAAFTTSCVQGLTDLTTIPPVLWHMKKTGRCSTYIHHFVSSVHWRRSMEQGVSYAREKPIPLYYSNETVRVFVYSKVGEGYFCRCECPCNLLGVRIFRILQLQSPLFIFKVII